MNTTKTYYRIAITLFSIAILYAVANSFINYDAIALKFQKLGYPTYLISVIGGAQLLGLTIILLNKGKWLIEWAYAGFFMNFLFGIIAHLLAKDGNGAAAVVCLVLVWTTYIQNKKMKYHKETTTTKNKEPKSYIKVA
ncbi:DoxX-like protein [Maribacter vaceletii]|uniref:DoxX-like protein n=1 Tax=Maribacter vaceletii TaxID=1206816 RepID=A0A495EEI1_9FLAO|nr:DoxX family protein [Maribacter vaceletii]RKR15282.1 DoxX-like protein [Maribacter vaceletii]